jgi:ATP-grasp domain
MQDRDVILLHSRQPLGVGTRNALSIALRQRAWILTEGKGPLFRDTKQTDGLNIVELPQEAWEEFIASQARHPVIVTNDEFCLQTCQRLRRKFTNADIFPSDIARFRDKALMRETLTASGIPVPPALVVSSEKLAHITLDDIVPHVGNGQRYIVKPVDGANLRGIRQVDAEKIGSTSAFDVQPEFSRYLIEPFLDGKQYHVECLVTEGKVEPLFAGRYLTPLLDLASGKPSGSITLDRNDPIGPRLNQLAQSAVQCLGSTGCFVAHVEFLSSEDTLYIGEVACRAPGGDIPWQSTVHTGIDIEETNLHFQYGQSNRPLVTGDAAAWLWFPGKSGNNYPATNGKFVDRFLGRAWLSTAKQSSELEHQIAQNFGIR